MRTCFTCREKKPLSAFHKDAYKCKPCVSVYDKRRYAEQKERLKAIAKKRYHSDPKKSHQRVAEWISANPERRKTIRRRWEKENPDYNRAKRAEYRARQRRAIPTWDDKLATYRVYDEAVRRGLQVDHVVPLNNPLVCGLHCWWNLQLLDGSLNASKSNREWPDMPGDRE